MRILHTGDLHPKVNGTYAGKLVLDPTTGYSVAFEDCRKSLQGMLDWEAQHPCDLAIIGGDIWDNAKPTPAESSLILWFLSHLLQRMPVVCLAGNHDMDVNTTAATALEPLRWFAKVTREAHAPHELVVMTQPERALIQTAAGKACVAGVPYPSKGRFQAAGEGDGPEVVLGKMNQALRDLVRGMNAGMSSHDSNIMVAHGSVSGASVGEQPRAIAHDLLLPLDEMDAYEYVALNHIHKHQLVGCNGAYSGSLLCQSFGEMNEPKGWCVVEVENDQPPVVTHIPNPHSRRFQDVSIDELKTLDDINYPPDAVYRITGEVTEVDYPEAALAVAKFEQTHPFTQNNLETLTPDDRVRDASMTTLMSADEAVERVVRTLVPEESVAAVMARHREIQGVPS